MPKPSTGVWPAHVVVEARWNSLHDVLLGSVGGAGFDDGDIRLSGDAGVVVLDPGDASGGGDEFRRIAVWRTQHALVEPVQPIGGGGLGGAVTEMQRSRYGDGFAHDNSLLADG